MNPQNIMAIERELLSYDWGKLRRFGYADKLIEVIGERYAARAIKPMPLKYMMVSDLDDPMEHFAQLVIDKTFGVTRHEQSTATFGPERATNGFIRWSGSMENSPEGGHCDQLSVAGHQPRIGR